MGTNVLLFANGGQPLGGSTVTVMRDAAVRQALDDGGIEIDPRPEHLKAASVDFRLGPEAFLGSGDSVIQLQESRLLAIPPGEMALVTVHEKVSLGDRYAGHIGLRSAFARRGLALLAGPQIDPGFKGRLHLVLVNPSPVEITIAYEEPLITIVFHDLGASVDQPYGSRAGDEFHEQDEIRGEEIDDIRQHRGYAMSEVIRDMQSISQNVASLRDSVDGYIRRTDVYLRIFVGAIVALTLGAIATGIGVIVAIAAT